jgi:uncharacterized protein (TIGR00288 family)
LDETPNIAVFCDYENVAIGVADAKYDAFDIQLVLERLLDKGKVIVKKAYCDWDRYKVYKRPMHEAGFELIEVPHVSYSGKNSADVRLVVDALDMCYTKSHLDVFVVISGDSDFSPLVGKLRENNKTVICLGVKNSSSDLLIESCDEFIYYDDLVRERRKEAQRQNKRKVAVKVAKPPVKEAPAGQPTEGGQREEAIELVMDTVDALLRESDGQVWGSMVKQTLKRKRPHFSEAYYGYRSFNQLLEEARDRKLIEITKDEKSGGYVIKGFGINA